MVSRGGGFQDMIFRGCFQKMASRGCCLENGFLRGIVSIEFFPREWFLGDGFQEMVSRRYFLLNCFLGMVSRG
jgi:hypothetical protein